jgi:serine/threonine protein kinase
VIDGRYRVLEVLGEGGMGAVYLAEHLKLHKHVALKTIRARVADEAQHVARFSREAMATAQIEHPHVVSAIDFGELPEGGHYLVMQLVRGASLTHHIGRGAPLWPQAAELGAQIADALAAAHAVGVVHRDLKPDNVLLEEREGRLWAKVVDFGIARVSSEARQIGPASDGRPITAVNVILGTPGYMAPEQALAGPVDGRADLYALGVILWEMCAGRRLWTGKDPAELFHAQLTAPPPDLLAMVPGIPPALAALISQLLDHTPGQRPAPGGVRDELRSLAHRESRAPASPRRSLAGLTASPSPDGKIDPRPLPAPPATSRTALVDRWRAIAGRRRRVLMALGCGVLATCVLLARCACADDPPTEPTPAADPGSGAHAPATPPASDVEPGEPPPRELPAAYADHAEALLRSSDRKARKAAVDAITRAKGDDKEAIPLYLRNIAWLEKSPGCPAKKAVLRKMEEDDDPRVVPALRQLAATPKNGCREFLSKVDCVACLRGDLKRILGHFESRDPG